MISFFFFKQKTAYEMRISDWSSDVCSSDLHGVAGRRRRTDTRAVSAGITILSAGTDTERLDAAVSPARRRQGIPSGRRTSRARIRTGLRREMLGRSEQRRVGQEGVSTCRSRWSPVHYKTRHVNVNTMDRKQQIGMRRVNGGQ